MREGQNLFDFAKKLHLQGPQSEEILRLSADEDDFSGSDTKLDETRLDDQSRFFRKSDYRNKGQLGKFCSVLESR
jgi:hypothetical protein